jgi:Asp-tRNA(Asn)/Glu-tRNA(Gln) amidotransferase B subunit
VSLGLKAITSISTRALRSINAEQMADLAGGSVLKYAAYALLKPEKSLLSTSHIVDLTTLLRAQLVSAKIARIFSMHWRV